jgi:hypothetical protein
MAQVVDAKLHLEAVAGRPLGHRHQPGVVDEQVDGGVGRQHAVGRAAHRRQVGKIQLDDLQGGLRVLREDLALGRRCLGLVAGRHHHVRTGAGQRLRRLQPEATVGPGDDGNASAQVAYVVLGPDHDWSPRM